jgi:hypothetical protein
MSSGDPTSSLAGSLAPETVAAPPTHAFLKAKFRVGSCKGPKNFPSTETVFHPDDVPTDKRANKMKVKQFLKPSMGTRTWDTKTTGAMEIFSKRTAVNLEFDRSNMYRYNYRAEVLPAKQLAHVNMNKRAAAAETMSEAQRTLVLSQQAADPVLAGKAKRTEEMPVHPKLAEKTKCVRARAAPTRLPFGLSWTNPSSPLFPFAGGPSPRSRCPTSCGPT